MTKTELLSPCGEYECFLAAVNAGADAVYLGGDFSARAYAKNFTGEEIINAIDHAHLHGKKVYLTLNILLKEAEIDTVADYLTPFYEAGLDGVIVQDPGVIRVLRHCFPDLHVHASTQMTVTDTEGVRLLTDAGASRVVLARELSLDEIRRIHDETNAELECFIHGALCYSYSGKCLMSSLIGGRSGNRGRCAQPCRLPYN
ncbi:MAG: U32 family peptidase, partial [Lachnospiraceae bacterium]|nr:U32 family peptidase [Lachnospiraceae bacterium]